MGVEERYGTAMLDDRPILEARDRVCRGCVVRVHDKIWTRKARAGETSETMPDDLVTE